LPREIAHTLDCPVKKSRFRSRIYPGHIPLPAFVWLVVFSRSGFVFAIVEVWFFGFWATELSGVCVNISLAGTTIKGLLRVARGATFSRRVYPFK